MKQILIDIYWFVIRSKNRLLRLFYPNGRNELLDLNGIKLLIDTLDGNSGAYKRQHHEVISPLYRLIRDELKPFLCLDIGANYGFISTIMAKTIPDAIIYAIEPNERLIPYIYENLRINHTTDRRIIRNAMCGLEVNDDHDFFINPNGSLDSRVIGEKGWKRVVVPSTSIYSILNDNTRPVFIKIDTQGYEKEIMYGGEKFFNHNNDWLVKMEFAPYLLEHHGTCPVGFLHYLSVSYEVTELPPIIPYNTKSIDSLFYNSITIDNYCDFIEYVRKIRAKNRGWVDLLIRPKQ